MNLQQKIDAVKAVLTREYEFTDGKIFISFSGGKDSTVLKHIAESIFPDIHIVFSNTTNELSEIYRYIKQFDNLIHVHPVMGFEDVVKNYGFPLVSKEVSQKVSELKHTNGEITRHTRFYGDDKGNGKLPTKWRFLAEEQFDITHKCCKILKKDPLERWAKTHQMKPVIALMADESALRKQLALFNTGEKKCYPFLETGWTEEDIWAYAALHNIRFAECYYDRHQNNILLKARKRTGCEYCAFGIHLEENDRFERSRLLSPKRYEKMMNLENNGVKFSTVIQMVKAEVLPKPKLDLYGVVINQSIGTDIKKHFFIEQRDQSCKCTNCKSKDTSILFSYKESYFDTPMNNTPRTIWITKDQMVCNDCGHSFVKKTPMANDTLKCTDRLIDYINQNKDVLSFDAVSKITMVNKTTLIKILQHIIAA